MALPSRPPGPGRPAGGLPTQQPSAPPAQPGPPVFDEDVPELGGYGQLPVDDLPADGGYPQPVPAQPAAEPRTVDPVDWAAETYALAGGPNEAVTPQAFTEPDTTFDGGDYSGDLTGEAIQAANLLLQVISDDESTEVIINGPNEVLQKIKGQRYHVPNIQFGDADTYHTVLNEFVLRYSDTRDRIDGINMHVNGQLEVPSGHPDVPPMLARVHILCPPLVRYAKVTIAKKNRYAYDLDGIAATGAMTPAMAEFLKAAARGRLNMVFSGPTGAGKTTLLEATTREFDINDRVVVIEDTRELRLPLADVVYLEAGQEDPNRPNEGVVTMEWLVKATQRMRMNRVIVGECRGGEIAEWLIAANSGADGSLTSIHANNPRRALEKILNLATKSPTAGLEQSLRREIAATVDIIIQANLIDDRYVVTHIAEVSNAVRDNGIFAITPLFEFNRAKGRHEVQGRPSEDLVDTLRQRGVTVNPNWFRGALS